MKKRVLACLAALTLAMSLLPVTALADEGTTSGGGVTDSQVVSGVSKSKTATELNTGSWTSDITLSLPSAEEKLATDIVLALDVSKCTEKTLPAVKELLNDLAAVQKDTNANIKVGISMFKGCAVPFQELTTLTSEKNEELQGLFDMFLAAEGYEDAEHAVRAYLVSTFGNEYLNTGTNMPAGLMLAKEMLDQDTEVEAGRKFMVLISDGSTYLFTHGNNYSAAWSRSHAPNNFKGGLYENNWRCDDFLMKPDGDWSEWLESVSEFSKTFTDEYDYQWTGTSTVCDNPIPMDATKYLVNGDTSIYQATTLYKAMQEAGYNCYYCYADDTEDYYGRNSLKSLNDDAHLIDAKETENIFANIENEIIYLVDAGSFVNDYMGYVEGDYNFDLVNQASKLYITEGKTRLDAVEIEANKYGFGMWKEGETVGYKYVVTYTPAADGQEHIEWTINVPVTNLRHVQLHYTVELTNPKTAVGTYGQYDEDGSQGYAGLYTNNSATLYPMATGATETGEGEDFLKPTVSYEVKGGGGTIITPVKPDPKPDPDPEPPTDIDEPTTPSDPGSDIDEPETPTTPAEPPKTGDMMPLFAGMAAVSAAAIMLLSRKRKEA